MNEQPEQKEELKKELDNLLLDLIGAPKDEEKQINNILTKAIEGQIKTKTAIVAIHELMRDYENQESKQTADEMTELYKKGYR